MNSSNTVPPQLGGAQLLRNATQRLPVTRR